MNLVKHWYSTLPDCDLPGRQMTELVRFAQSEQFYHLAAAKELRIAALTQNSGCLPIRKVFLSANLAGFDCRLDGIEVVILEKDFFQESDLGLRSAKKRLLDNAVVIVNNNDVGAPEARSVYAEFYEHCPRTFFIVWDWDNHHWLDLSTFLAAHSDIYAPAHHENLYILSRYNWLTTAPVYCSSVQWPRAYLTERLPDILSAERLSAPLGMHIPYSPFNFRIQVIATLNRKYPSIGFSDRTFHVRTREERFTEWCSHKAHWIVPVLNDVPIRIFDALITGGIPIVPASLRLVPPINKIPHDYIAFYSPSDIVKPEYLVERANELFDRGGRDGIVTRHRYALERHHGESSIHRLLDHAEAVLR